MTGMRDDCDDVVAVPAAAVDIFLIVSFFDGDVAAAFDLFSHGEDFWCNDTVSSAAVRLFLLLGARGRA